MNTPVTRSALLMSPLLLAFFSIASSAQSDLTQAKEFQLAGKLGSRLGALLSHPDKLKDETIRVVVDRAKNADRLPAGLRGRVEAHAKDHYQLSLSPHEILSYAGNSDVAHIRLPFAATTKERSESVSLTAADQLHARGVTGAGARVAILDIGFSSYTAFLGNELPNQVSARNFNADGFETTAHGTAVSEIVHDMAPDADLTLVAFGTDVEYMQARQWLIEQQPPFDIVTASIGFDNVGPLDGTSEISATADRLFDEAGILYLNSAGNEQQKYFSEDFQDSDGDGWHNFGGGDNFFEVEFNGQEPFAIILNWDDWGSNPAVPTATQDFDLYLWCPNTVTVDITTACAVSDAVQSGQPYHAPLEFLDQPSPQGGVFLVGIRRTSGSGEIKLRTYFGGEAGIFGLEFRTAAETLSLPADGRSVVGVGAHHYSDVITDYDASISADDPAFDISDWIADLPPEAFSSLGPTWDGRRKPDLSAADGVTTTVYGPGGFFGTSAAAPHAAGAAALLKSEQPNRDGAELRRLLLSVSEDVSPRGMDNAHGAGRLNLAIAAQKPNMSTRTALWQNASQSGHGFSVDIQNGVAVIIWYIYDLFGNATWLLATGPVSGDTFSADLLSISGPAIAAPVAPFYDAAGSTVSEAVVGTLSMEFTGDTSAVVSISLDGTENLPTGLFSVTVEPLLTNEAADQGGLPYQSSQNGIWNNPGQNGHGFFVLRQGFTRVPEYGPYPRDSVAVIWYSHSRLTGEPAWLLAPALTTDELLFEDAGTNIFASIFKYSMQDEGFDGTQTLAELFGQSNPVHYRPDGELLMEMMNQSWADMTYNFWFSDPETLEIEPFRF